MIFASTPQDIFECNANRFGKVAEGYAFECEKHNGKRYRGDIVKVAAYTKGTLVTICYAGEDGPAYRSIYLEDCKVWYTLDFAPYYG